MTKLVQETLEKPYPKVSQGGGFEILRSGATVKELVVLLTIITLWFGPSVSIYQTFSKELNSNRSLLVNFVLKS